MCVCVCVYILFGSGFPTVVSHASGAFVVVQASCCIIKAAGGEEVMYFNVFFNVVFKKKNCHNYYFACLNVFSFHFFVSPKRYSLLLSLTVSK